MTAAQGIAGDEAAGQRRAWDSNPRTESPRSAVFKTGSWLARAVAQGQHEASELAFFLQHHHFKAIPGRPGPPTVTAGVSKS